MNNIVPYEYIKETKELVKGIRIDFIRLGGRLLKIRDERLWEGIYESWEEFLEELDLSKTSATRIIQVYKVYVIEKGVEPDKIAEAGITNLYEAIPMLEEAKSEEEVEEIVEKAKTLKRDDIKQEAMKHKAKTHEHHWHVVEICYKCGAKRTIKEYKERVLLNAIENEEDK